MLMSMFADGAWFSEQMHYNPMVANHIQYFDKLSETTLLRCYRVRVKPDRLCIQNMFHIHV